MQHESLQHQTLREKGTTHKRWLAGVVDIEQVAIQIHVAVLSDLDRRIRWSLDVGAGREGKFRKDGKRSQRDFGHTRGPVLGLVHNDLLDIRVRGLDPMGLDGCHLCREVWCE
jgi:hypothetical protein